MVRTLHRATRSLALTTEAESSPVPSSFFARVAGAFLSPARTFENIARHPRFFAPFLATLSLFAAFWGVVYLKLGLSGMAVAVVQYFRRGTLVRQDEIDFALQFSGAVAPAVLIGGAIALLVHLLIIAWAGARIADLFFGVTVRFRAGMSLAVSAYLAKTIPQIVLGVPIVLFGGIGGLNFGNLLPTNIAFFLDPADTSRMVYAILQSLDVVQIGYFALLGIGFATDSDDPAAPTVMAISLGVLWLVWNVGTAALRDVLMGS